MGELQKPERAASSYFRGRVQNLGSGRPEVSKHWLSMSGKSNCLEMSAIFSFCLEVRLSEHLSLKVQDEADNRNPDTIPRLCLPNHPISVTPICHFITFELIFVILFFSLKCFPGLEFPFNSGLKSYTLHNSNNNILAGS